MKQVTPFILSRYSTGFKTLSAALLLTAFGATSALADVVYVTGMSSNCTSTPICGSAENQDYNWTTWARIYTDNAFGAYTSAKASASTATGKPNTPGSRYFSYAFTNSTPDFGITLNPSLAVTGGVYMVYHTFSASAGNVSADVVLGVTNVANCTLSFTNTTKFQSSFGNSTWQFLGYLTNGPDSSNPTLTFYYQTGTVDAGAQKRLLVDTFRFYLWEPCLDVPPVGVTGPLATNISTVVATGVTNTATKITIYQLVDGVATKIGEKTGTLTTGNNSVTVSGLVFGAQVVATQTINGIDGCIPPSGPLVGGGANPRIRLALSVKEAPNATGPIGADGAKFTTNQSRIFFLGASAIMSGAAPADGLVLYPSNSWQTVTFQRGPDYQNPTNVSVIWNSSTSDQSGTTNDLQGDWGTMESIAFAIDDTNNVGPFELYIDNITNGGITNAPVLIEDFENAAAGTADYTFRAPGFSGTTSGFLLSGPNESQVSNAAADTGTKSLRVRFQWASLAPNSWLRLTTYQATSHLNPLFKLNDPISFRILLLPVGTTPTPPPAPVLSASTIDGKTILNWVGGHNLQTAPEVGGTYTNVPGVVLAPYTNSLTESQRFFRLSN